jgi:hypothetical protein
MGVKEIIPINPAWSNDWLGLWTSMEREKRICCTGSMIKMDTINWKKSLKHERGLARKATIVRMREDSLGVVWVTFFVCRKHCSNVR